MQQIFFLGGESVRLFFSHHHHAGDPQVGQEDEGADGDGPEVDGHVAAELHGHVLKQI